jgi:putative nucleotidyltransferase with HDIG domain
MFRGVKVKPNPEKLRVDLPAGMYQFLRDLSDNVAPVAQRLGLRVYLVGGAVRDLLEGREFNGEWDLVVFGGDERGAAAVAAELSRSQGLRDPVIFPRFGTYLVVGKGFQAEIADARLRSTLKPLSGDPLVDDALSRDFTLNALYIDLARSTVSEHSMGIEILDPGGSGLADLKTGLLRTPVAAALTLFDDPLRIFRAARLRAARHYRLSHALGRASRNLAAHLSRIAPERILDEMNRILLSPKPSRGLEPLGKWGIFEHVLPEIHGMVGFKQNTPYHFPDLFRHSLRVVDRCRCDLSLRWAALLHDCGKPSVRAASEENDTYYGHEAVGAELAERALSRLRAGKGLRKEVRDLIFLHMVHYQDQWSDRAVRRFRKRAGDHLEKLLVLLEADSTSLRLRKEKLADLASLKKRLNQLGSDHSSLEPPLDGERIMKILGVPPGPCVGAAKKVLSDAIVEGEIDPEKEAAEEFLLKWWKEAGDKLP